MNIRDIVNRDVVNLVNCESEPIHIPGSIQPHGFLLGLKKADFSIDFCSANTAEYIGLSPQQLLGASLNLLAEESEVLRFQAYVTGPQFETADPFVFTINQVRYNTTTHISGPTIILEFEPFPDGSLDTQNLYRQTKKFISLLEGTATLQELCHGITEEIRALTGYDRVMIYRFDKDYNGEVYAESKRADLQPFFGLNYPHTDIPPQARELYLKNLLRLIADINYQPVPLLTVDDDKNKTLDLSLSVLRSVSPIHIQYLQNMGVGATLTISLIEKGKLWGLVACHHYSYKNLPHYTRLAARLQGHFLTSQISVREVAEEYQLSRQTDAHLQKLLDTRSVERDWYPRLFAMDSLAGIANATGAAAIINGTIYQQGGVPAGAELRQLVQWLATKKTDPYFTWRLPEDYPPAKAWPTAAGILYHSLSGNPQENCIIWFREEVIKTINWAGNPDKAIIVDPASEKLSPRKSFALWQQSVRHQSREWRTPELHAASRLASVLQNHLHTLFLQEEEVRYRLLNARLKQANDELSNINWITTHDMKEPLRKIRMFTSKIIETGSSDISDKTKHSLTCIEGAAARMQSLIDDILSYSLLENKNASFSEVDLEALIAEIKTDLAGEVKNKNVFIETDGLPVVQAIASPVKLLFTNLIGNAIKFSTGTPEIRITHSYINGDPEEFAGMDASKSYLKICLADTGIGFEDTDAKKIFNVFYRLHPQEKYGGNGIGLAICKKIMDNHHGFIGAVRNDAGGATFCIYLPAGSPEDGKSASPKQQA